MTTHYLYGANVNANGIRLHYLRFGGQGQPLVLVPGITSPAATWAFVAERLAAHFDVYVIDVRGRGLSEARDDLDYGRDACTADIAAFVEVMGLTDVVFLGHSMGARMGLLLGHKFAKGLASLILVDPPMAGPGRPAYPASLDWYIDSMALSAQGCGIEEMRPFCPTWSDEHLRIRAEWLFTCSEKAVRQTFFDLSHDDVHADMPHIGLPVFLMAAGRGTVITPANIVEVKSLIPNVTVRVVPNAGHMIPYDDEADFFAALSEFLGVAF